MEAGGGKDEERRSKLDFERAVDLFEGMEDESVAKERERPASPPQRRGSLLRGETARGWLFLQPLVAIPAALALSTIPWPWRFSIIAVQWWILVCMKTKMYFVSP